MLSEEEYDELELENELPSNWAMLMEKKFQKLNRTLEAIPSTYKKQLLDAFEVMVEILSDVCFIGLNNERQLRSLLTSDFSLTSLQELLKPAKEAEDKNSQDNSNLYA